MSETKAIYEVELTPKEIEKILNDRYLLIHWQIYQDDLSENYIITARMNIGGLDFGYRVSVHPEKMKSLKPRDVAVDVALKIIELRPLGK